MTTNPTHTSHHLPCLYHCKHLAATLVDVDYRSTYSYYGSEYGELKIPAPTLNFSKTASIGLGNVNLLLTTVAAYDLTHTKFLIEGRREVGHELWVRFAPLIDGLSYVNNTGIPDRSMVYTTFSDVQLTHQGREGFEVNNWPEGDFHGVLAYKDFP